MNICYNLEEIFEIAEQIERNGAVFYRRGVEIVDDEGAKEILQLLAKEEDRHENTFGRMEAEFVGKVINVDDTDETVLHYLQAVAGRYVFDKTKLPEVVLTEGDSVEDILKIAIDRERDAIIFYLGIKDALKDENDRRKVDFIIKEEQRHFAELSNYLEKYNNSQG